MAGKLAGSSVPPHVGLSTGMLECPHHMVSAFLQNVGSEKVRNCYVLCYPALEVPQYHFYNSHWSHRLAPHSVELGYAKAWIPEGQDLWEPPWRLATDTAAL